MFNEERGSLALMITEKAGLNRSKRSVVTVLINIVGLVVTDLVVVDI